MTNEDDFWKPKVDGKPTPRPPGAVPRGTFSASPPGVVERMLERVRDWRSDARFGVVVLIAVAVLAGFVWYRIGIGGGSSASAASRSAPAAVATTRARSATTTTSAVSPAGSTRIAVHVAGAVARPGVVELSAGSRVIDAVEAVGGAPADADLDRLNLAAKLVDGERVFVPKVGQADPGVTNGDPSAAGASSAGGAVPEAKVNLNTATESQLEALPGIGPTYAQSILAERQRRGGFKSVNELRGVHGIGDKRFAELAPLVTV